MAHLHGEQRVGSGDPKASRWLVVAKLDAHVLTASPSHLDVVNYPRPGEAQIEVLRKFLSGRDPQPCTLRADICDKAGGEAVAKVDDPEQRRRNSFSGTPEIHNCPRRSSSFGKQ